MSFSLLHNERINLAKWDHCINTSINGSIFAFSWYMDAIDDDWHGLILDDYDYIMPLFHFQTGSRKFFYTPRLIPKSGIFSSKLLTANHTKQFFDYLKEDGSLSHIALNKFNKIPVEYGQSMRSVQTYEMDLINYYNNYYTNYHKKIQEDLRKSIRNNIFVTKGISFQNYYRFLERATSYPKIRKKQKNQLKKLLPQLIKNNLADIYGAYTHKNELCATGLFVRSRPKNHLLLASTKMKGIITNALTLIVDRFIEANSEKKQILSLDAFLKNRKEFPNPAQMGFKPYYSYLYQSGKIPWIYQKKLKQYDAYFKRRK